jgi:hypothetical protein
MKIVIIAIEVQSLYFFYEESHIYSDSLDSKISRTHHSSASNLGTNMVFLFQKRYIFK